MPRRSSFDDDFWYPPSAPLPVENGIKAKHQRGPLGGSWWARRWAAVLESFGWGNRIERGRMYARKGQVLSITIGDTQVTSAVQGSRLKPYTVTVKLAPLTDRQWTQAIDVMAQQAIFAASLLAGEMPQNIEDAFTTAGVSLFPRGTTDIATACSCPDVANPCKHIAAVYYLLGERFDDDPFLLFQLRGRTRDQILAALRQRRSAASLPPAASTTPSTSAPSLADLLDRFYEAGEGFDPNPVRRPRPGQEPPLLQQLGPPPAGTEAALRAVYQMLTVAARRKLAGDEDFDQ